MDKKLRIATLIWHQDPHDRTLQRASFAEPDTTIDTGTFRTAGALDTTIREYGPDHFELQTGLFEVSASRRWRGFDTLDEARLAAAKWCAGRFYVIDPERIEEAH